MNNGSAEHSVPPINPSVLISMDFSGKSVSVRA